jgi:hypothetical protein
LRPQLLLLPPPLLPLLQLPRKMTKIRDPLIQSRDFQSGKISRNGEILNVFKLHFKFLQMSIFVL